jgi:hypothetical protein
MTEEQYKRAVEINDRIRELKEVKNEIKDKTEFRLSYLWDHGTGDWSPVSSYIMRNIGNILDKHDTMIRAEIDEEIYNLTKEIETL